MMNQYVETIDLENKSTFMEKGKYQYTDFILTFLYIVAVLKDRMPENPIPEEMLI